MKYDAKQLRVTKPSGEELAKIKRKSIYIVLDNVLDTYNIGSIFRLADAVAATEVLLCGGSERPPSHRIHKAAVGTEEWVSWRYFEKTEEAILYLRNGVEGIKIIAVEQDDRAIPLKHLGNVADLESVAIVLGHESDGVSKQVLDLVDQIVEIPMWGFNKSLNVHVSASVVVYRLIET